MYTRISRALLTDYPLYKEAGNLRTIAQTFANSSSLAHYSLRKGNSGTMPSYRVYGFSGMIISAKMGKITASGTSETMLDHPCTLA